ncbi:MAG: hypothetical protein HC913_19225 [Microscillaceae bacterium]|nr:hypothetical protein [Microscillaceae bacterium]
MENQAETLLQLQAQIGEIGQYGQKLIQRFALEIAQMPPLAKEGAQNLLYYLAVRQFDIRDWQKELGKLGLSRLGKAEGHIQASLEAIQHNLLCLSGQTPPSRPDLDFDRGKELLEQNATALLGPPSPHRRVRIMVTLPSEAAEDAQLVKELLLAGMNGARINCAHDDAPVWQKMVEQVRQAAQATGLPCKICMDLAGPKLRTGTVATQTQVLRLCAPRDDYGRVLGNYLVWVSEQMPPQIPGHSHWYHLPLPRQFFEMPSPVMNCLSATHAIKAAACASRGCFPRVFGPKPAKPLT